MEILFSLQSQLATYLGIPADDIFNEYVNIERTGVSSLTFDYKFSTRYLVQPNCNISAIVDMRQKFVGSTAEQNLKDALLPQFTILSSSGEIFDQYCRNMSSSPPYVNAGFGTKSIQTGQFFSFAISKTLFLPPRESDMRLKMQLRFENGTNIPSNHWIGLTGDFLDEGISIIGVASSKTANKQQSYSFKLVAITPLLIESSQSIQFEVVKSSIPVHVSILLTHSSVVATPYPEFAQKFVNFTSSFLSVRQDQISLLSFHNSTYSTIQWTPTTLSSTPCNFTELNRVQNKLVDKNGNVHATLQTRMANEVNFSPSAIEIKLSGSCDPPRVNVTIPMLNVPRYDSLSYYVPENAFKGGGGNLSLALLDIDGNNLPSDSWIWLNNRTRTITGFPIQISGPKLLNYILRAESADGASANQNVTINLNWTLPAYNLRYQIIFSFQSALLPTANIVTSFLQRLKTYFERTSFQDIIILSADFIPNNRVILLYQNTTLRTASCDINGNNVIVGKLKSNPYVSTPNPAFVTAMQPHLTVTNTEVITNGNCLVINRKKPYFNFFDLTALNFAKTIKIASYCTVERYLVPEKLFMDEEEGNTRNLRLNLTRYDKQALPINNWVNLNSTSQTIFAVANDETYFDLPGSFIQYRLYAFDSDGKSDYAPLKFNVTGPPPAGLYNVTMKLKVTEIMDASYPLQLAHLYEVMAKVFDNDISVHTRSYKVSYTLGNADATYIWSPCNMNDKFCNIETIKFIRSKLFKSGTKEMNEKLNNYFLGSYFTVIGLSESVAEKCQEDPPYLHFAVPVLHVGHCGTFSYKIPDDTFKDKQDGNTSKLKLELFQNNSLTIASGYWLQFNSTLQTITAILTEVQSSSGFPKEHKFILVATDSSNLSSNTTITVRLNGTMSSYSHTFTMHTTYAGLSSREFYTFSTKLQVYFGDAINTNQIITGTEASGNRLIVTWSNCSLRYNPCDVIGISKIRSKIQTSSGLIRSEFLQAMQPEFTQVSLSEKSLGPCLNDDPPKLSKPFGPISVSTCQTYTAQIPEGTFTDKEQGGTRNLDLSLEDNIYHWISFNAKKQELKILLTYKIAEGIQSGSVKVTLVAKDLNLQQAKQEVTINVLKQSTVATQKITMQYRIVTSSNQRTFTELYDIMRYNITQYFSGASDLLSAVEFDKLPSSVTPDIALSADWSSCSLPRLSCDQTKVNKLSSMIQTISAFKAALQPLFDVTSTGFELTGICKDQVRPPIIQNPLPLINISYCGYLQYQIPANTFYDSVDGNTRNLSLLFLNSTGQPVIDPLIEFDTKTQTFEIVISDNLPTNLPPSRMISFQLKATAKRGLSVTENVKIRISEQPRNESIQIKINFAWTKSNPPSRNKMLMTVAERFASYLGGSYKDVHFVYISQEPLSAYPYFVLRLANCSIPYSPCDKEYMKSILPKLHNNQGTVPAFKSAMGTEIYITYLQIFEYGPCLVTNSPPFVRNPLGKIQVHTCSDFNYTLPSNTFRDEEDSILGLAVIKVDGIPISGNYRWLRMVSSDHLLVGIVTSQVIKNQPSSGYNITIRATDSGGLFTETHLIIQIFGTKPQELYQFSLQLSASSLGEQFLEEREVMILLNRYFRSRFANILSYTASSSTVMTVKCSICTLQNKCDEAAADSYFKLISTAQNKAPAELQNYFSYKYTILSSKVRRDPLCLEPQNPPVPKSNKWTITGSYCGGIHALVPNDMFNDLEDGNTRNLQLNLYLSNRQSVPSTHWLQLNKTSQVIYGRPTRAETLAYSSATDIILIARDKTGLEGNTSIQFSFTPYPEPKYIYKIAYQATLVHTNVVNELQDFAEKIQAYLKDSSTTSVGLIQHSNPSIGLHVFQYANCSISYNPCDTAKLNEVRNLLLTGSNLPTTKFKQAMGSFAINYGEIQVLKPCTEGNLHPPNVANRITTVNVSVCGLFSFSIPENTFYDTEDGNTRKLSLNLANAQNQPLANNFWLQLNKNSQTIFGYSTATLALELEHSSYSLILTATDSTSLSATNSFTAKVVGPSQILKDCQIQIIFTSSLPTGLSDIELVGNILKDLQRLFSLNASEIGIVDFKRHSNTQFTFSWSYCSASYSSYRTTVTTLKYSEYKQIVSKVLVLLFESDHKTVKSSFYTAFNGLSVSSVKTMFSGACANFPPVLVSITELKLSVDNCGYRNEKIQGGWFYDYEDGNTYNLKLEFLDFSNQSVGIESWANIDRVNWYFQLSLREKQRKMAASRFSFYLKATDSGGKSAFLPVYLTKLIATTTKSPFSITFEFTLQSRFSEEIYVNESIALSDVTSRLYSLNNGKNINTYEYIGQSAPQETRSFTWIPCVYEACSTSTTLQQTRKLFESNRQIFDLFKTAYLPEFHLQRAYFVSSCGVPDLPPGSPDGSFVINITMCSPLRYKLAPSTFVDSIDGEMTNLKVRLLSSDKAPVSKSSWLQLNTATLELYGIFQSSMFSSLHSSASAGSTSMSSSSSSSEPSIQVIEFYLEATNSRGLKSLNKFTANVLNYPYTADCYINVTVKRTFGSLDTLDLDVLYKLVNAISQFHNDQTIRIKIHKFTKLSTFLYTLTFSNCSFTFSSLKAAKWGLNESHRASLSAIFSRVIESNGTAKASFQRFLSVNGFTLEAINTSYSCIEEPPISKVKSLRPYAFLCKEFDDPLANDLFTDKRDGTNLQLALCHKNGVPVSPNEWVQLDPVRKTVYGSVTFMVKQNIPVFEGYSYLIVATDSSGRSANVSYRIKIANAPPLQYVRFLFGFQSIFTEYSRTADILLNVTRKLATYLNNNDQGRDVVFYSYDAINFVSFELCNFQCTPAMMTSTLPKLQKEMFKPSPSDSFKAAMGPEITPRYIFVNGPKCVESTTITIIVNHLITTNQQICGFINYVIPANVFSNSLGETTRDFLLTLKTSSGQVVDEAALIHFHQDLQTIHGVAVFSKLAPTLTYILTASSSRSTAQATSTNIKINFPDYNVYKETELKLCTFTATVTTTINPALTDVYILRTFMTKIASYLNSNTQHIQIISYTRSHVYPIKLTIKFSNCSWLYLLQNAATIDTYYQRVESTVRSIFQYSGTTVTGISSSFIKAMQPDFNVLSIISNSTTCTPPPDRPPKARNLDPITAAPCGEFNYQIPADLFLDEDGNTRNLKIEVLQNDGNELAVDSWIVFDNKTQTISGLPLNSTLAKQPSAGYSYRIKATDKLNQASFVQLVLKIDGKPFQKYSDMGMSFFYMSIIKSKYEMNHILAFTRKVSAYIGDPLNRFRVMQSTVASNRISITLMNCTRCNTIAVLKYYVIFITKIFFNKYMAPEFPVSFYLKVEGRCNTSSNIYYNDTSGVTYNVTFCRRSTLDFLELNGLTQLPPDTKFIVRSESKQPLPRNSWFWFNESTSILEAFPSESVWKSQPINGTQFSTSTALISTGESLGSFRKDSLRIIGTFPSSGLQLTAQFTSTLSADITDAYLISLVFTPLYSYLAREDLQVVSFTRQQGSGVRFDLKFLICSLPADCTNSTVSRLNNKIFESPNKLRPEFSAIFSQKVSVVSMTDNCKDNPPTIPNPILNLSIPICGVYRYKIPKTFAKDLEDGDADNLLISLRMPDNSLLKRDSWIQFNETTREIYALPSESFIRSQPITGWPFLIVVKDKGGKQATAELKVFLTPDQTVYYKLDMFFQTVNTDRNTPYLDIQLQFLTMISSFYFNSSLSQYRILSFTKTGTLGARAETFHIKFGNCSINELLCLKEADQLKSSQAELRSSYSNANSQFYKYMSSSFIIKSVTNESSYLIDKPPKVLNTINVIRMDPCGMYLSGIPPGTFYDEEQGTGLTVTLSFENGTKPSSSYWIQYINNKLYVVPHGTIKSGTYRMMLTASDRCGHATSTTVTVAFVHRQVAAKYHLEMDASVTPTMPIAYYTSQVKSALKDVFADPTYKTAITYHVKQNKQLNIQWKNCSIICNHTEINNIRNKIFVAYDVINPRFLALLRFNVTNITETYTENCTKPTSEPPVANRSILLNVSICRKLNFTVPFDTFYDKDDGGTTNLHLSLLTESKQAVSLQSWVQLDQNRQILYGYPRIDESRPINRVFRYLLAATDKEGYSTTTPLTIEVTGNEPSVSYKLNMKGTTKISQYIPLVQQEITLINKIGAYFEDYAINDMTYNRNGQLFEFTWSFCSMKTEKCDCYKIQSIRQKMTSLENLQQHLGSEFTPTSQITDQMVGICALTQKPELRHDLNEMKMITGQYFSYTIKDDKFFDYEDGFTRNLTLFMSDVNGKLGNSHWIKVQDYKICGLMTLSEAERLQTATATTKEYRTTARDRCGKETSDSYIVRMTSIVTSLQYKITIVMNGGFGTNCSQISSFIYKISSYINTPVAYIFVYNYTSNNLHQNTTSVLWGIRNITEKNCNNETVRVLREKFMFANGTVTSKFYDHMKPQFEVCFFSVSSFFLCLYFLH